MIYETGSKTRAGLYFEADKGGSEGGGGQAWLKSVPEEYRGHEAITGLSEHSDVYKNYIDLHTRKSEFNGEGMVRIPSNEASAEERAAFNKAIGVPDTMDGYKFSTQPDLNDISEGLREQLKPEISAYEAMIKTLAHESGISSTGADKFHAGFVGALVDAAKKVDAENKQRQDESWAKLSSDWKNDTDERVKKAVRTAEIMDKHVPGFKDYFESNGLGNDVEAIRLMDFLSSKVLEDTGAGGRESDGGGRTMPGGGGMFEFKGLKK